MLLWGLCSFYVFVVVVCGELVFLLYVVVGSVYYCD